MKKLSAILILCLLFSLGIGIFDQVLAGFEVNINTENEVVKVLNDIYIPVEKNVTGDVVAILGDITVDGTVSGDVVAVLGDVEINNVVGGEVVSVLGSIKQGPKSEIRGGIAEVSGFNGEKFNIPPLVAAFFSWGYKVMRLIITYGLGVLVLALLPEQEQKMAKAFNENMLKKFGLGIAAMLLVPVAIIAVIISIVGIPLLPVIMVCLFIIRLLGYVALALFVGNRIKGVGNLSTNLFIDLLFGVVILGLIRSIPILGGIFYLLTTALAIGVIIDTKFGTNRPWFKRQILLEEGKNNNDH